MSAIAVTSEIGALQAVLIHRPGAEIERMTQHDLDRMLFDDILAPNDAAAEHDLLADILAGSGATVLLLRALLQAALEHAPAEARTTMIARACALAGADSLTNALLALTPSACAHALVEGVDWHAAHVPSLAQLRAERDEASPFALRPLPNLMFLRDPCISLFDRVMMSRMATPARAREPLLVAFALAYAPEVAAPVMSLHDHNGGGGSIEGGDVLVLAPDTLVVGCSQRTQPHTLERVAKEVWFPTYGELRRIYAVFMPSARSVMHLDTIVTQIDQHTFLGHAPLVATAEHHGGCPVACLERDRPARLLPRASTLDVLRDICGPSTNLIPCGGTNPLHQSREQWTDGANAIALAPGHIVLYARNTHTVHALAEAGFRELYLSLEIPSNERREAVRAHLHAHARSVCTFRGGELSRARGGGRCLTMPLRRAPI